MANERKPCPFCGGARSKIDATFRFPHYSWLRQIWARITREPDIFAFSIRCLMWGAEGPWFKSPTSAVNAWNRRAKDGDE